MDKFEDNVTTIQLTDEYKEVVSLIPSLHKYKANHNITNLQKLCVEISAFCRAVYASTQNEDERKVYKNMLDTLSKV
ncbi:MAG: hypothetical protein IKY67_06000 [Paludibacteraceae bacterium]|nr:hypothetical protein [Paludibacteraceae bacterium]